MGHQSTGLRRRTLLKAGAASLSLAALGRAPVVRGQAKPFAGVTLNGASFQHLYTEALRKYIPEFEAASGAKVNFQTQGFPVFNQRMDLELSTQGRAYDFCTTTFIYLGRWIGAGWLTDLEEFIGDPKQTPPDYDADDFAEGSISHMRDAQRHRYGLPWLSDAMMAGVARIDILEKKGFGIPKTFDELMRACEATDGIDGVKAFTALNNHHWSWIPFLNGYGGRVFKSPPENLTPLLDTPAAVEAAAFYGRLLRDFSPDGVLTYSDDQSIRSQVTGRANIRFHGVSQLTQMTTSADSVVKDTARYGLMPSGPEGYYPGIASHGLGIPKGARNKAAAWAFIQWATSKEMFLRLALDEGYTAVTRASVISDPRYKKLLTMKGQDVAGIYLDILSTGARSGHMKYRTVPQFPQVGGTINKAIERIATSQQSAQVSMAQAQHDAELDLKRAGVKIDA